MANKGPVPPFNWKRSLLFAVIMVGLFAAVLLVGLAARQPAAIEFGIGGVAVGAIIAIAIGLFGPLISREGHG